MVIAGNLSHVPEVIATRPTAPPKTPLRTLMGWLSGNLKDTAPDMVRIAVPITVPSVGDTVVTGLSLSSQRIHPGDLYAALPGARVHGASFAARAVESGAVAVLTDTDGAALCADLSVPVLVVDSPRALMGRLAARIYGEPARDLKLAAVTGTQGKTTTTRLAEGALQTAGIPAATVGTVGTRINGVEVKTALTTPEAPDLHALFAVMRERGVRACAMEVSSHALVMGRVDGVIFDVAAFTNLGRDHLDFHADVEDYFAAKASLFTAERARLGLVNIDDEYGRRLLDQATIPMRSFSASGSPADWMALDLVMRPTGSTFTVQGPTGDRFPAEVRLTGDFNVANALCAIACLGEAGFDPTEVARGISASAGVPGRLEQVDVGQDFMAVVDYAHKPDAVSAALNALRPLTNGRLIIVIGAGGDRDLGKRSLMGASAARLADVLIVTDDNPRTEDPATIRAAMLAGAREVSETLRAQVLEVGDRREAIRLAVSSANAGDTVIVAGKGHETGQEIGGTVHPFDDRLVLREALGDR